MYTNITLAEVTNIIKNIPNNINQIPIKEKRELITMLNTVLELNYTQFNNQYCKQYEG
jgi:hypothetical protein